MRHIIYNCIKYYLLLLVVVLGSCYDDKGNYSYTDLGEIIISNIPENNSVLRGIDTLRINPIITSTIEGEISEDNPNYEFGCRIAPSSGTFSDDEQWHDLNPDKTLSFSTTLNESIGNYIGLYTVTDLRTGVATNYSFNITVVTSTYEGWMVLCNEGDDNKVRLDMVSVISEDNIVAVHDLLGNELPDQYNAKQLVFATYISDFIYMITGTGTYSLDATELTASETGDLVMSEFATDMGDELPERIAISKAYHYLTTNKGNIYEKTASSAGAIYGFPCNTDVYGNSPTYRVSPYMATAPYNYASYLVLAYDIDNQRFVSKYMYTSSGTFGSINELESPLFSWYTGMDLIYMSIAGNGTIAYAVMQAADGQRSVYAININGWNATNIAQQGCWNNITAEGFTEAKYFTVDPTYPYIFYSEGTHVYAYNLEGNTNTSLQLPGEEITMVKISPFTEYIPSDGDIREEWENYLLVGSYLNDATDDNGGILRMYNYNRTTNSFEEVARYDGFAKIVDVTYRER